MLVYLGAFWFTLMGTGIFHGLGAYTGPALVISIGMFVLGMGEWINHPPQWENARAGFFSPQYGTRKNCVGGWLLNLFGAALIAYGIALCFIRVLS